jgi:hypothetical protein
MEVLLEKNPYIISSQYDFQISSLNIFILTILVVKYWEV